MNRICAYLTALGIAGIVAGIIAAIALGSESQYGNTSATATLPAYGAALAQQAPPVTQPPNNVEERLNRLEAKLDRILKLIEDAAAEAAAAPPNPADARAALSSGATKCSQCHHANVADTKGGGFRLFTPAGQFAQLTARQRQQAVKRLATTDPSFAMPPPASGINLADAERAALAAEFGPLK